MGPCCRYDWAGSTSAEERDAPLWAELLVPVQGPELLENSNLHGLSMHARWCAASSEERKRECLLPIAQVIKQTIWFSSYRASVKGQVRHVCQGGPDAVCYVVLIEGGPVTRVEALEMPSIIAEVRQDLSKIGVTNSAIEVMSFKTVTEFENMVPKLLVQIHGVLVPEGTSRMRALECCSFRLCNEHPTGAQIRSQLVVFVRWWSLHAEPM